MSQISLVREEIEKFDGWTATKLTRDDFSGALAFFGLVMAVACCIMPYFPFKICFNACYTEPEFTEEDYDNVALTFSTDYDRENPLTI